MKLGLTQKRSRTWKRRLWTEAEDQAVREGATVLPGRTAAAVRARRLGMGVLLQERSPGRSWTEDEVRLLQEECRAVPRAELAERLGRTVSAVSQKLCSLGLGFASGDQAAWSLSGPDSAMWRGGSVASGNYSREWKRVIRPAVIARDNGVCRICGKSSSLQVHHIVPYAETQDHSLNNQVTLCISCHKWAEIVVHREAMFCALRSGDFSDLRVLRCKKFSPTASTLFKPRRGGRSVA